MPTVKLDEKDIQILRLLQENSQISMKQIAKEIDCPPTTVYAKTKRMEELGIIKSYKAVLDAKKLDRGATAFVLASFAYRLSGTEEPLSQKRIAGEISKFPEVQEVHIITGDWDILVKVKARDVDDIGKFVVDKLRTVRGIEKTLTCMVFSTTKETSDIGLEGL